MELDLHYTDPRSSPGKRRPATPGRRDMPAVELDLLDC